jgi:AbrB family looped-hinge helix DNA binding protein
MPIVKVKNKYQVTLPASVRKQINVEIGDVLEAEVKAGKITLTPKVIIERELALALEDVKRGRVVGPFKGIKAAIRGLDRAAKSLKK